MKKNLLAIVVLILTVVQVKAQGPTLNLVGSGSTLTKGTINTEVLTAIIQQKQEELRQRVFKDIVIKNFENADLSQKNFATYYYIYGVMKTITSEKNKTIITQNLMQKTTEIALEYGFTENFLLTLTGTPKTDFYTKLNSLFPTEKKEKTNLKAYGFKEKPTINTFSLKQFKTEAKDENNFTDAKEIYKKYGSLILDMAFDVIINNDSIKARKIYKDNFTSNELSVWYKADNVYQKFLHSKDSTTVKELREIMNTKFSSFINTIDDSKEIHKLIKNLRAKNQGLTDLTEDQYNSMRNLLKEAIEIIRYNYDNSVVAKISDFLLDYTIIEYKQDDAKKANLYVDIESLISALDQHYNSKSRKSSISSCAWFINPRPFLSIGTNYAYFLNDKNTLTKTDNGTPTNLQNLYFASEKIGFKIKFFDKKYSRSFEPGEKFKYKGSERVWLRPQKQATISDINLIIYGSGLLYNIANLKSNDNFNYAIIGTGIGFTFFNGLSANFGFACPFTDKRFNDDNVYFNAGFDIPIIDYIAALTKKN